jgi:hypothetical protein
MVCFIYARHLSSVLVNAVCCKWNSHKLDCSAIAGALAILLMVQIYRCFCYMSAFFMILY